MNGEPQASATWQGPIVEHAARSSVVRATLADAARRLDRRALLAWVCLVAAAMILDRIHFADNTGAWPPHGLAVPEEFWLSILSVEAIVYGLLVVAVAIADAAVERGAGRLPAYALAVLSAVALGSWLQYVVRHWLGWRLMSDMPGMPHEIALAQPLLVFLEIGVRASLLVTVYVSLRETRLASARTREAETARAAARRRTYESRLQAMQARVEPQFLSNALAGIRALGACHPEQATAMLDDLIAYLRAALPHLRESSSTLAREIDLARAWLRIAGAPQRESAGCVFDLDEAACDAAMPPMVLLPMIASVLDVGRVEPVPLRVCTSAGDGRLRVAVGNAAMRRPGPEPEVAATIRERLHALYGERATLRITSTEDDGTCATLEMPHETADCDHR